ncbi:MAG: hypothetical protein M3P33_03435 [bacterium]|nr:hypothetical protein [bacterium]
MTEQRLGQGEQKLTSQQIKEELERQAQLADKTGYPAHAEAKRRELRKLPVSKTQEK